MAQGMALQFYTSVRKWLKLQARKFWRLIPTFVEVTGEKLIGGLFTSILNGIKLTLSPDDFILIPLGNPTRLVSRNITNSVE